MTDVALLSSLTKLDVWLLARSCALGERPESKHLKEASPGVARLLRYLDGINYRDRNVITHQSLTEEEYQRVIGCDPASKCPIMESEHNWQIIHASELKNLPPVEWLIKGEIPRNGLVVLFGQSGAGKSFLSLDYALTLAQQQPIVYIAGEGEWGYPQRVGAWCKHHGQSEGSLYMCIGAVNLYERTEFTAFVKEIAAIQPVLVVVDTLAMCMTGANENDTRDMGLVIAACKFIQRELDSAVMIVHHVNKGGVAERGSGALRGAADVMLKVNPMDDVIAVESSKTKDVAGFPTRYFRLLPVPLGVDQDGNEVGSVVVVASEKVIQGKDDKLTNNQRKVLDTLAMEVFADGASQNDIGEASEIGRGPVWKILSRLIQMEHVARTGLNYKITERGKLAIGLSVDSPTPLTPLTPTTPTTPITSKSKNGGVKGVGESEGKSSLRSEQKADSRFEESEESEESGQQTWDEIMGAPTAKRRGGNPNPYANWKTKGLS